MGPQGIGLGEMGMGARGQDEGSILGWGGWGDGWGLAIGLWIGTWSGVGK